MRRLPHHHGDANAAPVTRAYVTAYHDGQAVETALKLRRELDPAVPLVVALARSQGITRLIRAPTATKGWTSRCPDAGLSRHGRTDPGGSFETVAHAIHRRWRLEQIREAKPAPVWAELDELRRESNREQALDITAKLHAIGCDIAPFRDWQNAEFDFSRDEIEILAKAEHDRWCDEGSSSGSRARTWCRGRICRPISPNTTASSPGKSRRC